MFNYLKKHYVLFLFILVTVVSIVIRICMLSFESSDYTIYLHPWFTYLQNNGGIKALATYIGNYNAPYMTIMALLTYLPIKDLISIKIVSIIFDFVLAFASLLLVRKIVTKKKDLYGLITYTAVLFMPQVMMNSALWGQCDAIYASFVILSLYFLIDNKYFWSFICLGIAFAFKLQFIFILPLYVIYYSTTKKYPFGYFFIILLVNIIMCLPAIIVGKPIKDVLLIYFNQTENYSDKLVKNFPNVYNLFNGNPKIFYKVGVIVALGVCLLLLIYCIKKKVKWNNEKIITFGIYSLVITTFLLPGMHERYLFAGEVLSIIYFIIYKKNYPLCLFMIVAPLITYITFLNDRYFTLMPFLSLVYLIIIYFFTKDTLKLLKE